MRYALTIICFYACVLHAQQGLRTINFYTTQNGLSDNRISRIRQDSRGFLWLATHEGLNRFDGYRFKKFFAGKNPSTGLAGNTILDMLEYRSGYLLIATANGLSVLNTFTSNFENEKISFPELKSGSGTLVNCLFKDSAGNIWINHSGELDLLDSNLRYQYRFTNLPWAKGMKGILIREARFTDKQNRLWLPGDTSGIHIIDFAKKNVFNHRNNPERYEFLKPKYIRSFFLDETSNMLWYSPWGKGLYQHNLSTRQQRHQDFGCGIVEEKQSVNIISFLANNKILCTNGRGCFVVDISTLQYQQVPVEMAGFPGQNVDVCTYASLQTANGQYWLGTDKGLIQLQHQGFAAKSFDYTEINAGEITGFLRSRSGKVYLSCENKTLIEATKDLSSYNTYLEPGKKKFRFNCLQQDAWGKIWVGTSGGLYWFDTSSKTFRQPKEIDVQLRQGHINFVYPDNEGALWIATRFPFGLYKYLPASGKWEKINNAVTRHFESLGENSRISFITADDKNQLWMVSQLGGGVVCYNKISGRWTIHSKQSQHQHLLSKGLGFAYAGQGNDLWLYDGFGNGLIEYNYQKGDVNRFTRNDGLPSDLIKSICYDGADNLWTLTEYGISKFDLKTKKVGCTFFFDANQEQAKFLVFDSLSSSVVCVTGNRLLFYPVDKLQPQKQTTLQPIIDKVWVNSKEVKQDVNGESLKFEAGQNNVSIDFTVVRFSHAEKIRFAYKLAGADKDWKYSGDSRSAQYAVLTPGDYTFQIKLADENGNWTRPHNTFSFTIVHFFWQTIWFKIMIGCIVAGTMFYFFKRRIKNIRHEAEMKKQIAETEMMALRAQMNPHFIFNCLNSIDSLIQTDQKDKATIFLAKFAKLIRAILENSKQNVVACWKDLETLKLYVELEEFRWDNAFTYMLDVDEKILQGDYKVPPLVVQPFVENAIHHGLLNKKDKDKQLHIKLFAQNGHIQYIIKDNGVGRQRAKEYHRLNKPTHISLGMQITSDRIRLFNGDKQNSVVITDLRDNNNQPAGTKVEVNILNQP